MSWDPVWEHVFSSRASWGMYPPEELVRFAAAHYYSATPRHAVSILEVGCGPGGGPSWYLAREGFNYSGIDASETAIEKARARFKHEGLEGTFLHGDFAHLPWQDGSFDCVIDVAALQHNDEISCRTMLAEIHRVMKPGGHHFSLTVSDATWGAGTGDRHDKTTRRDVLEGPYVGLGLTRFATRDSLRTLYAGFRDVQINHSIRSVENGAHDIANWILTCSR